MTFFLINISHNLIKQLLYLHILNLSPISMRNINMRKFNNTKNDGHINHRMKSLRDENTRVKEKKMYDYANVH